MLIDHLNFFALRLKTFSKALLFGALSFVLFSCSNHIFYSPNSPNVPLFKEKNEAQVRGLGTISANYLGYEVQGAYSISNRIGIIASYQYNKAKSTRCYEDCPPSFSLSSRRPHEFLRVFGESRLRYGEIGLGYYFLSKKKPTKSYEFFLTGGYGFGDNSYELLDNRNRNSPSFDFLNTWYYTKYQYQYSKFALQFDMGNHKSSAPLIWSFRVSYLYFDNLLHPSPRFIYGVPTARRFYHLDHFLLGEIYGILRPELTKTENADLNIIWGLSIPMSNGGLPYAAVKIGIGFTLSNTFKKKKPNK